MPAGNGCWGVAGMKAGGPPERPLWLPRMGWPLLPCWRSADSNTAQLRPRATAQSIGRHFMRQSGAPCQAHVTVQADQVLLAECSHK